MKFAKLYNIKNSQVLYTTDNDSKDEETPFSINIRCHVNGIAVNVKLSYKSRETMEEDFNAIDAERAKGFYKKIYNQLNGIN